VELQELKDTLNSDDFKSKEKGIKPYAHNAIEKVGAVNMNNAVWIIKYIAELKMFDRSAQYKTKCAYWQCRLSELTNTLFTLTKRASHIFYLVSSLPKKWILTFNKFSNLQRFFCRI
jgi:hypothetical protein